MSIESGLIAALSAGRLWNSQSDPPKVYVGNTRVHHYQVGMGLAVLGLILRSPTITGVGIGLFLDDIDDVPL